MDKMTKEQVRQNIMAYVTEQLGARGEQVVQVGATKVAFPFVYGDGEEAFMELSFAIPKGPRDGSGYDGFEMARDYQFRLEQKAVKAEKAKQKKAAKIKADTAKRAKEADADVE